MRFPALTDRARPAAGLVLLAGETIQMNRYVTPAGSSQMALTIGSAASRTDALRNQPFCAALGSRV